MSCKPTYEPAREFIAAACVPRDDHASGTLDAADAILAAHPEVAGDVYAAPSWATRTACGGCSRKIQREPARAAVRTTGTP